METITFNPMQIRATDFVMFQVSDLARAAAFYRDVLGLRQEIYSDEYHWAEFDGGNVTLSLHGNSKAPEVHAEGRIAFAVADIQAVHEELKAKAVPILSPPFNHTCCWHLELEDPDGNRVILHQRADGTCGQEMPKA
jgi:predicted enzyme related to lactoylglutathione lyase